jgi:hypothetical protein
VSDEANRCTARSSRTGKRCAKAPIAGGTVCPTHGGRAPQVKAAAAARIEAARLLQQAAFDPAGVPRDPGEVLLAMLAMTHARVAVLAAALAEQHDSDQVKALTADTALARLEREERDRAGRLAKTALDAGIAERQVRLAERQGELLVTFTERLLTALGHDPTDKTVRDVVHQCLLTLEGGPT